MIIPEEKYLQHYGILRKSGRYPWGSGKDPEQRSGSFLGMVAEMKAQGLSETQIAEAFNTPDTPFNTTDLRATRTIARNAKKAADIARAQAYKERNYSNVAIGEKMGIHESSVRALLAPGAKDKNDRLTNISNMLREEVRTKGAIQVGKGTELNEHLIGVNGNNLGTALAMLKAEGYQVLHLQVDQVGSAGNKTTLKVLVPEGVHARDLYKDLNQIKTIGLYTDDNGRSFSHILPPLSVDSKRLKVAYKEDGGDKADGVIYVRPGKEDISLGGKNYAQVRVMVDDTHYLKGMAMYKDDLPPGVDLQFNTNKSATGNKLDALKPLQRLKAEGDDPKDSKRYSGPVDQENPFGSIVRQIGPKDEHGRTTKVTSAMNIVNEEGDWDNWSKTLSAQMLSKQKPSLVKERLDETFKGRKDGLDEILALDNPVIKKKLLESYAEDLDAAAVHLKAAGLPRQQTKVILPMNSMKSNEIYAPSFDHGERVVLVRYPHGGKFEIPELTVNNTHREAKRLLGKATDAVGIHHSVAARLSGADFDGDTVVVIPNNSKKIQTQSPLQGLKGFDPQSAYPSYPGMPKLGSTQKQKLMGDVSNLITDMTIRGANDHEIMQAVKHSMVVIDAEKHNLNYKQSALDNNIQSLKAKYQDKGDGSKKYGASTLISQKKSPIRVPERKLQKASQGGSVDPKTGKKIYRETGVVYPDKKTGKMTPRTSSVKKLEYFDDAHDLSSGTPVEKLYADHSNRLKAMANQTRLAALNTGRVPYSESANRVYAKEVSQLDAKLNVALRNSPRERQAQVIANAAIQERRRANPGMDKAEVKKMEGMALLEARNRVGAKKTPIYIEDEEWNAIQSGAVRHTKLTAILDNADLNRVKQLATPRKDVKMTTAKKAQAQRLMATGMTQAQVADKLGVSLTTLKRFLNGEG